MPAAPDPIRYIIVVHGIAEQRKGETVLAVINRCAEARRNDPCASPGVITLGMALGQTGRPEYDERPSHPRPSTPLPWLEFGGIPRDPSIDPAPSFLGLGSGSGQNLRFVDLWWADLMKEDEDFVLVPPSSWARGLIGRLKLRGSDDGTAATVALLEPLAQTLAGVDLLLTFRHPEVRRRLMLGIVGDVQQYGEYALCRGAAVRRFHRVMEEVKRIHEQVTGGAPARFTIIAHSLGSVLALDALTYAYAQDPVRGANRPAQATDNLPFPGYLRTFRGAPEQPPSVDWVDDVDCLVTIGSPIDKYLNIWWFNYGYLNDPGWIDQARLAQRPAEAPRIRHLNFADEQDPVGHRLNDLARRPVYRELFDRFEDMVFSRYLIPGMAHNEYWNDLDLFKWILRRGVDTHHPNVGAAREPVEPVWFSEQLFTRVTAWAYLWIPLAFALGLAFTFTSAVTAPTLIGSIIWLLWLAVIGWFGRRIINLMIAWRQGLKQGDDDTHQAPPADFKQEVKQALDDAAASMQRQSTAAVDPVTIDAPRESIRAELTYRTRREQAEARFRARLRLIHTVLAVLFFIAVAAMPWMREQIPYTEEQVGLLIPRLQILIAVAMVMPLLRFVRAWDQLRNPPAALQGLPAGSKTEEQVRRESDAILHTEALAIGTLWVVSFVAYQLKPWWPTYIEERLEKPHLLQWVIDGTYAFGEVIGLPGLAVNIQLCVLTGALYFTINYVYRRMRWVKRDLMRQREAIAANRTDPADWPAMERADFFVPPRDGQIVG